MDQIPNPKIASRARHVRGGSRARLVVLKAHLSKLGHNLNIVDDVRQCGIAVRVQGAVGSISHPIEGLFELRVLCEVAWVVWIVLMHRVAGVVGTIVVPRGAVVV